MNTRTNKYLAATIMFCLTACSATFPISGKVEKTNERFLGTATATMFQDDANIKLTMENGTTCTGTFPRQHVSAGGLSASGKITCNDNRTGTFTFGGTPQGGNGFGKFSNGDKFDFVYGGSGTGLTSCTTTSLSGTINTNCQ